jgi:hypothetical protein
VSGEIRVYPPGQPRSPLAVHHTILAPQAMIGSKRRDRLCTRLHRGDSSRKVSSIARLGCGHCRRAYVWSEDGLFRLANVLPSRSLRPSPAISSISFISHFFDESSYSRIVLSWRHITDITVMTGVGAVMIMMDSWTRGPTGHAATVRREQSSRRACLAQWEVRA